jgi:dTDP-4-dehydrorhamnose reductase
MKYLIAGKNGQLARAFIRRFEEKSVDFLAPEKADLDVTDFSKVSGVCDSYRPDVIINCAAYNLVDKAEEEPDRAFAVNAQGPKLLAAAAQKHNAIMVHFGTDYVFDGAKRGSGLYTEADAPDPLSRYGESKLAGERFVLEESGRALVFRVSWVFGEGKQNFISKLMEWAKNNEVLRIADDEISVPTYTCTIAETVLRALDRGLYGLYHLTSSGSCSRYEWASLVLKSLGIKKIIKPVPMDTFKLPARRPGFSAMSNKAVSAALNTHIPGWDEEVELFLRERFSG